MTFSNRIAVINPDTMEGLAFIDQSGKQPYTLLNEHKASFEEADYTKIYHNSFRTAKRYLIRKGFTKVIDMQHLKQQYLEAQKDEQQSDEETE